MVYRASAKVQRPPQQSRSHVIGAPWPLAPNRFFDLEDTSLAMGAEATRHDGWSRMAWKEHGGEFLQEGAQLTTLFGLVHCADCWLETQAIKNAGLPTCWTSRFSPP